MGAFGLAFWIDAVSYPCPSEAAHAWAGIAPVPVLEMPSRGPPGRVGHPLVGRKRSLSPLFRSPSACALKCEHAMLSRE